MISLIHPKSIVVLDCGGQYTHLIANRIRRMGAFSEIHESNVSAFDLKDAAGIIISGGPQSVYAENSPKVDPKIFDLGIPILGICYGHQLITYTLGGKVEESKTKEYGYCEIELTKNSGRMLRDIKEQFTAWMSHGDEVHKMPPGFHRAATSDSCKTAAMAHEKKHIYSLQFHPEVTHTEYGSEILQNFVDLCDHSKWSLDNVFENLEKQILKEVGEKNVFILVSGGVDSSVAFALLNKAIGPDRVYGLLVDHGLLRKNEARNIADDFEEYKFDNLHVEDASNLFLKKLKGELDPEKKRQIIGDTFLEVQADVARRLDLDGPNWLIAQGTIYPDTIETGGTKYADKIKTHHNRVDAIQKMIDEGKVIEPLKDFYKDEVRKIGQLLGLPHHLVWRHPFPGPGLAVRIICSDKAEDMNCIEMPQVESSIYKISALPIRSVGVQGDCRTYRHPIAIFLNKGLKDLKPIIGLATALPNKHSDFNRVLVCTSHQDVQKFIFTETYVNRDTVELLREVDHIVTEEMCANGLYDKIWQFPVVLIPIGIKEGERSIVLRPVDSQEAMTANATLLKPEFLESMTNKIMKIGGIGAVFYDVTNKPPATIEWE
ncbi:glutamine-hydrolyzing GMP synthase [Candidatus Peribacteria bacterium]|jgi:GMP synthase (glutamine-hydrolysing)|nr:glutamine-hydrolyzing GMP synthase [Candidatus Peribacteria bacterium]MBT4021279.1 glutamine-hydrolyzing GMP synthase [Candidatus Peribacteria bacterium]MBT4240348.1 glutamine-hydrolyzing GMP synthase [Candidatus Peribacteria bacterium]MBT4474055.1 glutamine-hydrolyzing GMP synthase [Candidatus Peribacteria bacterium]